MQIFVKQRATETGDINFSTPAIDVQGVSLLVTELIAYSMAGGGGEAISAQLQASSDLDTWTDVTGALVTVTTGAGTDIDATLASASPYGRYVRFNIVVTGNMSSVEYSLVLNTHASS